ncbi:hypothetical protein SmJEL517_g00039 [Synchytrium microbalum]|uniref:UDENN domain-containing protein n=1 Tax=Synchytrium microbalum TaxID=1806994 RepID=A0A507C9J7_9FUNG|nr:uncharacterized protein SmJEL517_g00039 [Synchytrium microbalum]TPX38260.1 hypothetical protein SmJEL517_g00039 [Synchytrium microbalum]
MSASELGDTTVKGSESLLRDDPPSSLLALDVHVEQPQVESETSRSSRNLTRSSSSDGVLASRMVFQQRTSPPPARTSSLAQPAYTLANRSVPFLPSSKQSDPQDDITALQSPASGLDIPGLAPESTSEEDDDDECQFVDLDLSNDNEEDDDLQVWPHGAARTSNEITSNTTNPQADNVVVNGTKIPSPINTTPMPVLSSSVSSSKESLDGLHRPRSGSLSSTRSTPYSPADEALAALSLKSFWRWILCFCVVNFDLELGQAMELIYPPVNLTESQRKNICFSAFPDSNSKSHLGDTTFCFRIRASSEVVRSSSSNNLRDATVVPGPRDSTGAPPPPPPSNTHDHDSFLHGYVFFRQQKDQEVRRGFFQKSLVLLTSHPWPGLMLRLVAVIGPTFMDALVEDRKAKVRKLSAARALLDTACHDVANWPPPPFFLSPQTGYSPTTLELPFSGTLLTFSIPPSNRFVQYFSLAPRIQAASSSSSSASIPDTKVVEIACPAKLYRLFASSLEMLWTCWEFMLLGEPILVVADNPRSCSEVVWALVELIKPIAFGGDFRPYLTIQDADFKTFANRSRGPPAATILGVTNPVFSKVLEHWPNVIRVTKGLSYIHPPEIPPQGSDVVGVGRGYPIGFIPPKNMGSPKMRAAATGAERTSTGIRPDTSYETLLASMPELTMDSITTKHKPFFSKDKKLIRSFAEIVIRGQPAHGLDNILRRHFVELTERFLQPLNRHFEGLVVGSPANMSLSALKSKPEIKPFRQETFLKSLESSPPQLGLNPRRPTVDFYRLFLKSANFASWLRGRIAEVNRVWRTRYLQVLTESNIVEWIAQQRGADVVVIDLLMRISSEIDTYESVWDGMEDAESFMLRGSVTSLRASIQQRTSNSNNIGSSSDQPKQKVIAGLIPTPQQYERLIQASQEVLEALPEDLRNNVQMQGTV